MQSCFLCSWVSGYCCKFHVCAITCGRSFFGGRPNQFLECFSVFFGSFSAFCLRNHICICLSFFLFPGALFHCFSWNNWRHFAVALHGCLIRMCWPAYFQFFSMRPPSVLRSATHRQSFLLRLLCQFLNLRGNQWPFLAVASGPWTSLSNNIAVSGAVALTLRQCVSTFVVVFCAENLTAHSPVQLFPLFPALFYPALFPALFPALPWMLPSVAGTLRLPPIGVYPHLWPSLFDSLSLLSSLLFVQRTSPLVLQRGFSPFPVLFPTLFPALPWKLPARFPQFQVR